MGQETCEVNGSIFPLGQLVITAGATAALTLPEILGGVVRHATGDYGNIDEEDWKTNQAGLNPETPGRLMSSYTTAGGVNFWIITEYDRSVTTVLLPEEY